MRRTFNQTTGLLTDDTQHMEKTILTNKDLDTVLSKPISRFIEAKDKIYSLPE